MAKSIKLTLLLVIKEKVLVVFRAISDARAKLLFC